MFAVRKRRSKDFKTLEMRKIRSGCAVSGGNSNYLVIIYVRKIEDLKCLAEDVEELNCLLLLPSFATNGQIVCVLVIFL